MYAIRSYYGEGTDPLNRDFILKEDFIKQFTNHCEQVQTGTLDGETNEKTYGMNFTKLAEQWLSNRITSYNVCYTKLLRRMALNSIQLP